MRHDDPVLICYDCFVAWYDDGLTDPAKIAETVRAKRREAGTRP